MVAMSETEVAGTSRSFKDHDGAETVLMRQMRWFVGFSSVMSGALHILAADEHRNENGTLAWTFLGIAAAQILWGIWLCVRRPNRLVIGVGLLATAGFLLTWISTRTGGWGVSWYPGMDHNDGLGWRDVVCQFFQVPVILAGLLLLLPHHVHHPADDKPIETGPLAAMAVAMLVILGVTYAGTRNASVTHGHASLIIMLL